MKQWLARPMRRTAQQGYGLIVIAALFTAFAVVAAAMIDRNNALVEIERSEKAHTQLKRLAKALDKFARYNNNRYPCPASRNEPFLTSGTFGAASAASCYTGVAPTGTVLTGKILIGMVPVRVLVPYGISLEDAYDPWNGMVLYAVHRDLTTLAPDTAIVEADRPQVTDWNTSLALWPGDLVLFSTGRDRLGGRIRNQTSATVNLSGCSAGTDRNIENCDLDGQFMTGPLNNVGNVPQAEYFDDILVLLRR